MSVGRPLGPEAELPPMSLADGESPARVSGKSPEGPALDLSSLAIQPQTEGNE